MINHRIQLSTLALYLAIAGALGAQSGTSFEALVGQADAARDSGKMTDAIDLYQKALHLRPDWKQGWWVLGSILYDANRYQEGEEAFLPLTKLDPDKSAGWAMAGLCEFEIKHYQDALSHLERADSLGLPTALFDVTRYHIELILIRTGNFDPAIEMISRSALQGKDNPKIAEAMGIAALRKAALPDELTPKEHDMAIAVGRAMCDAAASRTKDSIAEFDAIVAKYPDAAQVHYLNGMVLLQSDPDRALAAFNLELKLMPTHVPSLISIAAEYAKRNEFATALPYAEKAVASDSHYFATHAMLGKVLVEGNLDAARGTRELEAAVEMAPGNPQSRLALATAYAKAGRKAEAAQQRAEFLRLRTQLDKASSGQK